MEFAEFCREFEKLTAKEEKNSVFFREGEALLSELMKKTGWFQEFLGRIILDMPFRQQQKPSRWLNEYNIHKSPEGNFVMLAYIWEPKQVDIIHDHNSWGVVGTLTGMVSEKKYRRTDDGSIEGHAELREISSRILMPSETTSVAALEGGIHRMENLLADSSVSINVYGRSVRKGYLNFYDIDKNSVTRTYVYSLNRAALAIRALGTMDGPLSESILRQTLDSIPEDSLKQEAALSLRCLKESGSPA